MNATQLKSYIKFAITNTLPVMITGIPGIGKSEITETATKESNANFVLSHPVVSDPTDYKGLPFATKENGMDVAKFIPFDELNTLINAKEPTVYMLDDLGQAPASVQAACMQLVLARRINGHKVSDKVTFIAATNGKSDKAGVSGILEPVKSRFTIVELSVDVDAWVQWALQNNMPHEIIAFIKMRPEKLSDFAPTKDISNSPSPRNIADIGRQQNAGLSRDIEQEVFKGRCGEKFATEYAGFLQIWRSLPDVNEIILNPKGAPVSDEPSVLYAICGMIAQKMNDNNIEAFKTYLDRVPDENAVLCMQMASQKNRNILHTKTWAIWSAEKGNLM